MRVDVPVGVIPVGLAAVGVSAPVSLRKDLLPAETRAGAEILRRESAHDVGQNSDERRGLPTYRNPSRYAAFGWTPNRVTAALGGGYGLHAFRGAPLRAPLAGNPFFDCGLPQLTLVKALVRLTTDSPSGDRKKGLPASVGTINLSLACGAPRGYAPHCATGGLGAAYFSARYACSKFACGTPHLALRRLGGGLFEGLRQDVPLRFTLPCPTLVRRRFAKGSPALRRGPHPAGEIAHSGQAHRGPIHRGMPRMGFVRGTREARCAGHVAKRDGEVGVRRLHLGTRPLPPVLGTRPLGANGSCFRSYVFISAGEYFRV